MITKITTSQIRLIKKTLHDDPAVSVYLALPDARSRSEGMEGAVVVNGREVWGFVFVKWQDAVDAFEEIHLKKNLEHAIYDNAGIEVSCLHS